MTIFEKIKEMSAEDLACYLHQNTGDCYFCLYRGEKDCKGYCKEGHLAYLLQEEGETEETKETVSETKETEETAVSIPSSEYRSSTVLLAELMMSYLEEASVDVDRHTMANVKALCGNNALNVVAVLRPYCRLVMNAEASERYMALDIVEDALEALSHMYRDKMEEDCE